MAKKEYLHHSDYELITPGKSWIFVNPSTGCPLRCAYCIEQKDSWFEGSVSQLYTPEETLDKISESPLVVKDKSPLTFYNYSDLFLPQNREGLFSILEEFDRQGWRNKVGLITKLHPGEENLKRLSSLENIKLGLFVSYANLLPGLEAVSYENRIKLMEDAHNLGIPTVDYVRPLVEEWVTDEGLEKLAYDIKGKVDAVSLSGMRMTPEIVEALKLRGVVVPEIKSYTNKQRDYSLSERATDLITGISEVPVFWHTSCAMSYLHHEADYNSHDIREKRKKDSCGFPCIEEQRKRCNDRETVSEDTEISKLLGRLGKNISFKRDGQTILLSGDQLNREDVSFVRHLVPEFVVKEEID